MTINPKRVKRAVHYWIGGLVLLEVAIASIYLGGILFARTVYPPFDMDGRMTLPTLLQASILFQLAFAYLLMFFLSRRVKRRPSPYFWLVQSVLLFYVASDELFKLHLGFGQIAPVAGTRYWIGIYSFLIVAIAAFFFRDIKALWNVERRLVILGVSGLSLAVIGGFGTEMAKSMILTPVLYHFFGDREVLIWVIQQVRVAVEEFLELLGETLLLYAVLLFTAKKIESKYGEN